MAPAPKYIIPDEHAGRELVLVFDSNAERNDFYTIWTRTRARANGRRPLITIEESD